MSYSSLGYFPMPHPPGRFLRGYGATNDIPRVTSKGERGADVVAWQQYLMSQGYSLPRFGADGDHGSETEAATQKWLNDQAAAGVDVSKIAGADIAADVMTNGNGIVGEDYTKYYIGAAVIGVALICSLVWVATQSK